MQQVERVRCIIDEVDIATQRPEVQSTSGIDTSAGRGIMACETKTTEPGRAAHGHRGGPWTRFAQ